MRMYLGRFYTGFGIYPWPFRAPFLWVARLMALSHARQRRYELLSVEGMR